MKTILLFAAALLLFAGCGGAQGLPGIAGATGPAGPTGATGPAGSGAGILSNTSCSKIQGLYFQYRYQTLTSGDVFIECSVSGSTNQSSGSYFFKSSQNGAAVFGCSLTYDGSGGATGGYWTFSTSGTTRTATYHDSGDAQDGSVITFASSDCITI